MYITHEIFHLHPHVKLRLFTAPIFTKCVIAQRYYVEKSYTEFHEKKSRNIEVRVEAH
jgi:hypothetical protein